MKLLTIQKSVQEEIVIEKSRFICSLQKVDSEEKAVAIIKEIKKHYWDATHNCHAYIIGEGMECQKSSDDGEPSGTAGIPMLEVLKKKGLHNVLAVVTRYFGGIKLGSGGLIRAYTKSVSEAVLAAGVAQKILMLDCCFTVTAGAAGKIISALYQQEFFVVVDVQYTDNVLITLRVREEEQARLEAFLQELLSSKVEILVCNSLYVERPFIG